MKNFLTFMSGVIGLAAIFITGLSMGLNEPHTEVIFENCNELIIDTISYNCENNTYTFKVNKL